ncbi:MAG: thiaminase II [Halobacteria archaeon]
MKFSNQLVEEAKGIWDSQMEHPFVVELAEGTLDREKFEVWVRQDYRYLLDYARVFALAGTKARKEETMTQLFGVAYTILDYEMDLHREFADSYGIEVSDLENTVKSPTCEAYTSFLVRTAFQETLPVIAAAVYPCGQGYLDVAEHMAEISEGDHVYTPFIEKYTSDEFRHAVRDMTELVDRCAERNPGEKDAMREAFLTTARLEERFWTMCYEQEKW